MHTSRVPVSKAGHEPWEIKNQIEKNLMIRYQLWIDVMLHQQGYNPYATLAWGGKGLRYLQHQLSIRAAHLFPWSSVLREEWICVCHSSDCCRQGAVLPEKWRWGEESGTAFSHLEPNVVERLADRIYSIWLFNSNFNGFFRTCPLLQQLSLALIR